MLWWLLAVTPSVGLIWIVLKDVYRLWPSWLPMSTIGLVGLGATVSLVVVLAAFRGDRRAASREHDRAC